MLSELFFLNTLIISSPSTFEILENNELSFKYAKDFISFISKILRNRLKIDFTNYFLYQILLYNGK